MSTIFPPGLQLGRSYRVSRLIQSSGLGAVFEVQHLVTRERRALKWLRFDTDGAEMARRVAAQVEQAQIVAHSAVSRVLEVVVEGTSLFVVSELVEGDCLHWALSPHALSSGERLRIVAQAMHGVAEAHAQGVIHRGLHPGNVLVEVRDGAAQAKVVDFATSQASVGLHTLMRRTVARPALRTLDVHVYLSPEQLRLDVELGPRSDIYTLAVVAYQAITGRVPHSAPNVFDLAVRLATVPLEPASVLCPRVPRALDDVLSACLAYESASRPPTLHDLVRELESFGKQDLEPQVPFAKRAAETSLFVQRGKKASEASPSAPSIAGRETLEHDEARAQLSSAPLEAAPLGSHAPEPDFTAVEQQAPEPARVSLAESAASEPGLAVALPRALESPPAWAETLQGSVAIYTSGIVTAAIVQSRTEEHSQRTGSIPPPLPSSRKITMPRRRPLLGRVDRRLALVLMLVPAALLATFAALYGANAREEAVVVEDAPAAPGDSPESVHERDRPVGARHASESGRVERARPMEQVPPSSRTLPSHTSVAVENQEQLEPPAPTVPSEGAGPAAAPHQAEQTAKGRVEVNRRPSLYKVGTPPRIEEF